MFHGDSYGYRPGQSAIDAVRTARQRCWRYDWVLDLDVKGYFDSIDWELMLKAVRHHTDCPWVLLYIERWLKAPVQMEDGSIVPRTAGTPQGGVIMPLPGKSVPALRVRHVDGAELSAHPVRALRGRLCATTARRGGSDVTQPNLKQPAAQEMRVGPSDPDCRIRVQTTGSCSGTMAGVVSVTEKAGITRQVCAGKTNASEPLMTCRKRRDVVETRLQLLAWDRSSEGACRLAERRPA